MLSSGLDRMFLSKLHDHDAQNAESIREGFVKRLDGTVNVIMSGVLSPLTG